MQVTAILDEMGTFLDQYSMDDGWSDWLRTCAERYATVRTPQERVELLHMVRNCEESFGKLDQYLPDTGQEQDCPGQTLRGLISLLDHAICLELEE